MTLLAVLFVHGQNNRLLKESRRAGISKAAVVAVVVVVVVVVN